jgi:glycosyltransferase involved in cell wall biosynthesis
VIVLDLSRLLSRAGAATPSGIDRVELAYARHLSAGPGAYGFAARSALGGIGLLPKDAACAFVAALAALWRDGAATAERKGIARLARRLRFAALYRGAALQTALRGSERGVYLVVSHQNLDRPRPIERLKSATGTRFVCLIHDLIPLDLPHLTRPGQTARHQKRIAVVAALADSVIVNSAATGDALRARLGSRQIPVVVAPLGLDLPDAVPPSDGGAPYFVCIGTIELRKNHGLLLDVWQRLTTEQGDRAPRLLLIGQHGFGSQRVVRRLAGLGASVIAHTDLPDRAMAARLRGARALLLPSFAEGFGLPVAEALARGVPVLCSDLRALRESGGGVPDYLDPHDAGSWLRAVADFTADSPRRQAQLARLVLWRPPRWDEHFAIVEPAIAAL